MICYLKYVGLRKSIDYDLGAHRSQLQHETFFEDLPGQHDLLAGHINPQDRLVGIRALGQHMAFCHRKNKRDNESHEKNLGKWENPWVFSRYLATWLDDFVGTDGSNPSIRTQSVPI